MYLVRFVRKSRDTLSRRSTNKVDQTPDRTVLISLQEHIRPMTIWGLALRRRLQANDVIGQRRFALGQINWVGSSGG